MAGKHGTVEERFWSKVAVVEDGCWPWMAGRVPAGYGSMRVKVDGKHTHRSASRISWLIHYGPILDGLGVLHKCDNPICVRPDHLFLGTPADNHADKAAKGRSTRGVKNPMAKLNEDAVRKIRRLKGEGWVQRRIAEHVGVSYATVSMVLQGDLWGHVA